MKICLISLAVITVFTTNVTAQLLPSRQTFLKDKNTICNSDYSINYFKSGQRESIYSNESDERVWLKFTNTSKKNLEIDASDTQRSLNFIKGESKELDIYYEVIDKKSCEANEIGIEERPINYSRREAYFTIKLKHGESFVFSVARQYLLSNRAIYIPYKCIGLCGNDEKNELKKAYFFDSQLPKPTNSNENNLTENIKNFLDNSHELRNYSENGFTSTFSGEFRSIPKHIEVELSKNFPDYKFYVAKMNVLIDPPADYYDLILFTEKSTLDVKGFVWSDYWMLRPSKSFSKILDGYQVKSKNDAAAKIKSLAKLITSLSNDGIGAVGGTKIKSGAIKVQLLRGGVFANLEAKVNDRLEFSKISIKLEN